MSFKDVINKPVKDWTEQDFRRILCTTDGIGEKKKQEALDFLLKNLKL
jgi:hypothetical protein